jgi:hypothetical protein
LSSSPPCYLGMDSAFPVQGVYDPAVNGGWQSISQYPDSTSLTQESQVLATAFLIPGEAPGGETPSNLTETYWDVEQDLARFGVSDSTNLVGVLWVAVRDFAPPDSRSGEVTSNPPSPRSNLRHHYQGINTSLSSSFEANFPLGNGTEALCLFCRPAPVWGTWVAMGESAIPHAPDYSVPFVAVPMNGSSALPISQDTRGIHLVQSSFDGQALSLLALVGQGSAELLTGDDVAWGTPFGQSPYSSIIVQTGTTSILGGLRASGHTIVGTQLPGVGKVPDPPDARAYDALDGRLYSAHVASRGSSLTAVDVAQTLGGTPISNQVSLTGTTPAAPIAMVWSGADRALFVLDSIGASLRLIKIETTGACAELWRTLPTHEPMRAFLGAGYNDGLVFAVSTTTGSDVVLLDAEGQPRFSQHVEGVFFRAPVENSMGLTLPMARNSGGSRSNLEVNFVARSSMSGGICDAAWLRSHSPGDRGSPFAEACGRCAGSHDHDGIGDSDDGHE